MSSCCHIDLDQKCHVLIKICYIEFTGLSQEVKQPSLSSKKAPTVTLFQGLQKRLCYFDQKYEVFFSINQFGDQQEEVRDLYLQAHDIQGKGYITGIE